MRLALERGQPGKVRNRVRQGNGLHPITPHNTFSEHGSKQD
jgi:hypothetical protein